MDDATIRRAGSALIDAVTSSARVVLLGQSPRGGPTYFLWSSNRIAEMARPDRILGRMLIPADVAVVNEAEMDRRHDLGAVIREVTM